MYAITQNKAPHLISLSLQKRHTLYEIKNFYTFSVVSSFKLQIFTSDEKLTVPYLWLQPLSIPSYKRECTRVLQKELKEVITM